MKVHWRTEDRWLREFRAGLSCQEIARSEELDRGTSFDAEDFVPIIEDAIRRAILRREKRKGDRKS